MKHLILIFAALGLSACASNGLQLSASQCAADWRSVGVADGVEGAPETKINQYRSACAQTSPLASSDVAAWKQGWAEGADVAYHAEPASDDGSYEVAEAHDHTHSHGGYTHRSGPVFSPSVSIGVGSGGVRGGVGLGVGFGLFRLGLGLGFLRALALICLLALSGCATLTADQCKVADWRALGVEDGALGYGETRFLDYTKDCADAGVTPDRLAWEAGRSEGLKQFCTPEGAYSAGVDGRPFRGRCTPETPDQLAALEKGQAFHAISDEIAFLRIEILELRQEIRDIYYDSSRHRSGLTFAGIRSGALYGEIARLRHQITHLRDEREAYRF